MSHEKKKKLVIGAVVLTAIGAGTVYRTSAAGEADSIILASGTVEATEADLGFRVSGSLDRIAVREGARVAAGTEVASLDRAELVAERAEALAQVDAAKAMLAELTAGSRREEIARARAALDVATERRDAARRDVERLRDLSERSVISRQSFDHQETALGVAEGEVARAGEELRLLESGPRPERIAAQRAAVAQAAAAVERIDAVIGQAVLRAPFTGTITVRHREPGEAVAPGAPVLTVRNLDDRWVRIYVPGDQVGRLAIGSRAAITADADPSRRYDGVVSYIASVAEFTPRNVQTTKDRVRLVYEVRVRVEGDTAVDLKPGLPADVRFDLPAAAARHATSHPAS
jgi:HlyD family secretion protein